MPEYSSLLHREHADNLLRFDVRMTVFDQGEPNHAWYEVVSGAVRLCRYLEDGSRYILQFAFKGDMLGSSGPVYSACAEPLQPVVVRRHGIASISADWAMTPAARALSRLEQSIELLRRPGATVRVAAFLDGLARRIGRHHVIDLPMSRADIADHLGLTPSTVSRSLGSLARLGLIETDGLHRVHLLQPQRLAALTGAEYAPRPTCERLDGALFGAAEAAQ